MSSSTDLPSVYADITDPKHILMIFNSHPTQQLSIDNVQGLSVSAHRFRQIIISPVSADSKTNHISLMPVITFTSDAASRRTTCQPQIIVRIRRPDETHTESGIELCENLLRVWQDDEERRMTLSIKTDQDIFDAIREVEELAASVKKYYWGSNDIVDSNNAEDEEAFEQEPYGRDRYRLCFTAERYVLTNFARPVGTFVDGTLMNVQARTIRVGTAEESAILDDTSFTPSPNSLQLDELLLLSRVTAADSVKTFVELGLPALREVMDCDADLEQASSIAMPILPRTDIADGMSSKPDRTPLHVPIAHLPTTFDGLSAVHARTMRDFVTDQIPRINEDITKYRQSDEFESMRHTSVERMTLRPVNLFHLRKADAIDRMTTGTEPYA